MENENRKRFYRRWDLNTSRETVEEEVARCQSPETYSTTSLTGPHTPPDSDELDGKTLTFRCEGVVMTFRIVSKNELNFSENGGAEKTCFCNIKTLDHEIYLLNQLIPGYSCSRQVTLIADLKTGCATVCDAHIGTEHSNIDVGRDWLFGRLDGEYAGGELHHFTDELVGTAIEWEYGPDLVHVTHMYTSNLYYTYSVASATAGAWMATNPADYVKLRDNVFIFSFVEERQIGTQGLFVIDLDHLHDMGCFYGYGLETLCSACIGAIGVRTDKLYSIF